MRGGKVFIDRWLPHPSCSAPLSWPLARLIIFPDRSSACSAFHFGHSTPKSSSWSWASRPRCDPFLAPWSHPHVWCRCFVMPTSKFMLCVRSYGLALEHSGFILVQDLKPYIQFWSDRIPELEGSKFAVGFTNRCLSKGWRRPLVTYV